MENDIIVHKTFDENLELNGLEFKLTNKDGSTRPIILFYDINQDEWSGSFFEHSGSWSLLKDDVVTKLVRLYALNYEVREILRYKKWVEKQYEEAIATRLFAEACQ